MFATLIVVAVVVVAMAGAACIICAVAEVTSSYALDIDIDWSTSGYLTSVGVALIGMAYANAPWLMELSIRGEL